VGDLGDVAGGGGGGALIVARLEEEAAALLVQLDAAKTSLAFVREIGEHLQQ
jgi:hypothetical protein